MRIIIGFVFSAYVTGCAAQQSDSSTFGAQVGVVNHTANFIYSASVDGAGGGGMPAWGAGGANICCASVPKVWAPGIFVRVRWDMPDATKHNVKEKVVEVEKYNETGSIYLHFFPDDKVRVVVSTSAGWGKDHPIDRPVSPIN